MLCNHRDLRCYHTIKIAVEATAGKHRVNHHIIGADTDGPRCRVAHGFGGLAGDPYLQTTIIIRSRCRARLNRRVDGGRDRVVGPEHTRSGFFLQRRIDVADVYQPRSRSFCYRFRKAVGHPGAIGQSASSREHRRHCVERLVRCPPIGCNSRNPAIGFDNVDNPACFERRFAIGRFKTAITHRPGPDRRIEHIRKANVAREACAAVNLGRQVKTRGVAARQMIARRWLQGNGIGRGKLGCLQYQICKSQSAFAKYNKAFVGFALFPIGVPTGGCRLTQQYACSRTCFAAWPFELPDRGRTAGHDKIIAHCNFADDAVDKCPGVLPAQSFRQESSRPFPRQRRVGKIRIGRNRLNGDRSPISAKFTRYNLRQCGIDTLP